jgi:hypothetical protein
MSQKEKSNDIVNFGHATAFNEWIHRWDLMEISDPPRSFTWTNNPENPIIDKLDIILVSVEWENKYPTSQMRKRAGVGRRARARAGEREVGWWAGLRGGVQLAVGREGMKSGPGPGKENKEKENGFNSNLKLIFQIYSILNRSKQNLPELRKFEINYG